MGNFCSLFKNPEFDMGNFPEVDNLYLFSQFCTRMNSKKETRGSDTKFDFKRIFESNYYCIVTYWLERFHCLSKENKIDRDVKNRIMKDFLDTLYMHKKRFDILYKEEELSSKREKDGIYWKILRFASVAGLKYLNCQSGIVEKVVDFPVKIEKMYDCSECMRPIQYAASNGYAGNVHLLLNLGALPPNYDRCHCPKFEETNPILRLMNAPGSKIKYLECSRPGAYTGSIACYTMILSDTPYYSQTWKRINEALRQYSQDPSYDSSPSLQSITRFHIRSILKLNNKICDPNVWNMLKLPAFVLSYVTLDRYVYDANGNELKNAECPYTYR